MMGDNVAQYITLDSQGFAEASGVLPVYNFDSSTGEFTGLTEEYMMAGVGIPANSTTLAAPEADTGYIAVFSNGSWSTMEDHRGETVYSTVDGAAVTLTNIGEYPANTTLLSPATAYDKWDGAQWVTDATAQQAAAELAASSKKTALIVAANSTTQAWQTQLSLGIITDADKATLTLWMKYVQEVQAVDSSAAPNITWPAMPS